MTTSALAMRLLLISGKGGVGKTTVSAALALAAAKRGKRVLLVEISLRDNFSRLFDAPSGGHAETPLGENIWAMNLDPYLALEEYLETQLHTRRIVKLITGNSMFRRLVEIAPGWRDLITLGKVWHLERQKDPKTGQHKYDLIIVDAPATGHGLAFLQTPDSFVKAIRFGPPRTHSRWVRDLIRDPKRTRLILVTLPEELPVNEALVMAKAAEESLKVRLEEIVVNAVAPRVFTESETRLLGKVREDEEACSRIDAALQGEVRFRELLELADAATQRRALHDHYLRRLKKIGKLLIELPLVFRTDLSLDDLRALGEIIVEKG